MECQILLNHWRERKTGPLSFLAVVKCNSHRKAFTLYPYGLFPYKQQVLVGNLDLDGTELHSENVTTFAKGTLFEAACDKSAGNNWPKEQCPKNPSPKRFDTQTRHIVLSAKLLALSPQSKETQAIREVLKIDPLQHSLSSISNLSLEPLSQQVVEILKSLSCSTELFERLAAAGFIASLFPKLYLVCSRTKQIYLNRFQKFVPSG